MAHHLCRRTASAASTSARPVTALHTMHLSTAGGHWRFRVDSHTAPASQCIYGHGHIGVADTAPGRQQERTLRCAAASVAASGGMTAAEDLEPTVEEVMTLHPTVLQVDMNIKEAVHVMLDKDISGAPVVDASGKLVGVLSETDLIWKGAGVPQDHFILPPVFLGFADAFISLRDNPKIEEEVHKILARTVRDAMTSKVEVASPSMPMSQAASLMLAKQINMLPVVDGGKVVGVLTRHDVLRGIYASKSPFL